MPFTINLYFQEIFIILKNINFHVHHLKSIFLKVSIYYIYYYKVIKNRKAYKRLLYYKLYIKMVKSNKTLEDFVESKPTFSVNNKKELSEDIQLEVNSIMEEKLSLEDKLDKLKGLTKRLTAGDYEKHEEYAMAEEIIHSALLYYGINPPSEEKNKEQKEMLSSLDILLRKQIDLIQEIGDHKNLNTVSVLEDSLDAPIREFINPLNDRAGLFNVIFGEGWKGMLRFGIYNPENKLEYQAKTPEKELTSYARIKAGLFTVIGLGLVGVYSLFSYIENKTGNAGLGMTAGGLAAGGLGTILYYYYLKCEEYKKKFIEKNNDLKDHGGYKLLAKLNEFKSNPPDIEVISKKYNSSFKSYLRS